MCKLSWQPVPPPFPQLTAPLQKIEEVEHQLLSVVTKLKSRLKWLQSGRYNRTYLLLALKSHACHVTALFSAAD